MKKINDENEAKSEVLYERSNREIETCEVEDPIFQRKTKTLNEFDEFYNKP